MKIGKGFFFFCIAICCLYTFCQKSVDHIWITVVLLRSHKTELCCSSKFVLFQWYFDCCAGYSFIASQFQIHPLCLFSENGSGPFSISLLPAFTVLSFVNIECYRHILRGKCFASCFLFAWLIGSNITLSFSRINPHGFLSVWFLPHVWLHQH